MIKWEVFKELDFPCSDISYKWESERNARLIVIMHFSRVIGGCPKDLELIFENPIALKWEDESYGLIDLPETPPKCSSEKFMSWTYPTLIVSDSQWADLYAARTHTEEEYKNHRVSHFVFISMNDLLHVLTDEKPSARLIESTDAQQSV